MVDFSKNHHEKGNCIESTYNQGSKIEVFENVDPDVERNSEEE